MSNFKEPEIVNLADLGISQSEVATLTRWVIDNACQRRTTHIHSTTHDARDYSLISKTPPIFDYASNGAAQEARALYSALAGPAQRYFGVKLQPAQNRYAAVGHVYQPGDSEGEGHTDYYPSVNVYLSGVSDGGELQIARTTTARTIEQIRADAYTLTPRDYHAVFFLGTLFPHFVDSVPTHATGARVSVNLTYWDGSTHDISHPRYTHTAWAHPD